MASSASAIRKSYRYDVYLSFRGQDTRKNFVDPLYAALQHQGINTFKDDTIIKGKQMGDELIKSIEDSRIFIIVFSKNYASSSWCLNELVKIMECHKTTEQSVFPVFYDVEPFEVRLQTGVIRQAPAKRYKEEGGKWREANKEEGGKWREANKEEGGKWREALREASNLSGLHLRDFADEPQNKFNQKIVESILRLLNWRVPEVLIGMESRIKDLESSLEIGLSDVRMIGIMGIGGSGKSTLAKALFDKISSKFEGISFVENVREVSKASGVHLLQKKIFDDIPNEDILDIFDINEGKIMMKRKYQLKKILLVLDDVDHFDQLEALAANPDWFGVGSRIIITTRDEHLLVAHGVNWIHDVKLLSDGEAICLFSRYAFRREIPVQGYEELSGKVVGYAAGLPLTIKVLGSFLYGKNELEWIDALESLKTIPEGETLKKMELSYISLKDDYKEIFLDVTCLLKGWPEVNAIRILESCGFQARNGLRILEQKYLLTISDSWILGMHDLIEELGKNIVRRLHPDEPYRHSRLWIQEEIEHILANDLGTKATKAIAVKGPVKLSSEIVTKGFGSMKQLRLLRMISEIEDYCDVKINEVGQSFPDALQFLSWVGYPHWSLPKTFQANNLVALEMPYSRIVRLWEGRERKVLWKLKFLNLSHTKLMTLDVGLTPNLEALSLEGCHDLKELHMTSGCLKLASLNLSHSKLRFLDLYKNPNLEILLIEKCHDLEELQMPYECLKLTSLNLSHLKLRLLDLRQTRKLQALSLEECHDLEELHIPYECLVLTSLNLRHLKLRFLGLGQTPNLETLRIEECHDLNFHMPYECSKLRSLNLSHLKLRLLLDLRQTRKLQALSLEECHDLEELQMPYECLKLTSLNLSHLKLRFLKLYQIPNLETLRIEECNDLEELKVPIVCLKLTSLNLSHSKLRFLGLGRTPNLETLRIEECHDLNFHMPYECSKLRSLNLSHLKLRLLDLRQTRKLQALSLEECHDLEELHMPYECLELTSLNLSHLKLRFLNLYRTPNLETLRLVECHDLIELGMYTECLKLSSLKLSQLKMWTIDLKLTPNLETLSLEKCYNLVELGLPVECLKLVSLELNNLKLRTLNLGLAQNLMTLSLEECHDLVDLRINHSKLRTIDLGLIPTLERLDLQDCYDLVELHTSFGCLKRLVFLNLSGCSGIKSFLFIKELKTLKVLCLTRLYVKGFPDIIPGHSDNSLLELRFRYNDIEGLPSSIENLQKLVCLDLHSCRKLRSLPGTICGLRHLRNLKLYGCMLEELPEDIGQLECLEKLNLSFTRIKHLPNSICNLEHLKTLNLSSCWNLEKLPEDLGGLESLQNLILTECTQVRDIPDSICKLRCLKYFSLLDCIQVRKLPEELGVLKCLEVLNVKGTRIRYLPSSISLLIDLKIYGPKSGIRLHGFESTVEERVIEVNGDDVILEAGT